jgi:hypothetical protein
MHYPEHPARKDDPHYVDFNHYHQTHRQAARCLVGTYMDFSECKDAQGEPALPDDKDFQPGLELHHAHVEFSLQNGIDLSALEKDYPGISDPANVGAWVESASNFMWLCAWHHRGAAGAHTASASDFEAEKYVKGLISDDK